MLGRYKKKIMNAQISTQINKNIHLFKNPLPLFTNKKVNKQTAYTTLTKQQTPH